MARRRFVRTDVVRLDLSGGDWIDVKRELSIGEARAFAFDTVDEDGKRAIGESIFRRVVAYLVGWSFRDEDGAPVVVSRDAIEALDAESFGEIVGAINGHERAEAKNGGTPAATGTPANVTNPTEEPGATS